MDTPTELITVEPREIVPHTSNAEGLIARAIDKGVPVETLERLMKLHTDLQAQNARTAYFAALAAFQAECPPITRSKAVRGRNVKYNYAPLEEVVEQARPYLQKHGFSFDFDTDIDGQFLTATCNSHHCAGHTEHRKYRVPIDATLHMSAVQQYGAAGSYAKRYALINTYGLVTTDEDTDGAEKTPPPWQQPSAESTSFPTGGQAQDTPPAPAATPPATSQGDPVEVARALVRELKIAKPDWDRIVRRFGAASIKDLSSVQVGLMIQFLKHLSWTRSLRSIAGTTDEQWAKALAKRNVTTDLDLSPEAATEICRKLGELVTPFDRQKIGMEPSNGTSLGNSPSPVRPQELITAPA